ncbi:MAG: hypothetical protein U0800_11450 [Isosphaeraceae bacterium]
MTEGARATPIDDDALWTGRPDPEFAARSARVLIPIGGLFILSGTGFTIMVATEIVRWFFIFGLPIIGLGIALIDSPRRARHRAARTEYRITPVSAAIRKPRVFGGEFVETRIGPPELAQVEAVEAGEGLGHVVFFAHDADAGEGITIAYCRFEGIADAPTVARLARKALLTPGEAAPPANT